MRVDGRKRFLDERIKRGVVMVDCDQGRFGEEEGSGGDIGEDEKGVALCLSFANFNLWR